jgi:hypothetical protein
VTRRPCHLYCVPRKAPTPKRGHHPRTTYGIYEAAGGYYEPVVVVGHTDAAGRKLDALLLPHERQQLATYVEVYRNAGAGARQLIEATRIHTGELGSCDVVRMTGNRQLICTTCGVWSETAAIRLPA